MITLDSLLALVVGDVKLTIKSSTEFICEFTGDRTNLNSSLLGREVSKLTYTSFDGLIVEVI